MKVAWLLVLAGLAVIGFVLAMPHAQAADIRCVETIGEIAKRSASTGAKFSSATLESSACLEAFLSGTIVAGDYEKVREFYKQHYKTVTNLNLLSDGGDVSEAIQIGRLLRKYLMAVKSPDWVTANRSLLLGPILASPSSLCDGDNCICVSACALIWFGGVDRSGFIGLHRPRIDDPMFAALPAEQASKAYRQTLDAVVSYLHEMEVPQTTIEAMIATAPTEIRWLKWDEGFERPPSIAEWIDATCGRISDDEQATLIDLGMKRNSLSKRARDLFEVLEKKDQDHSLCASELKQRSVENLPPP